MLGVIPFPFWEGDFHKSMVVRKKTPLERGVHCLLKLELWCRLII